MRDLQPSARESITASGLLYLLRFGRFKKDEKAEDSAADNQKRRTKMAANYKFETLQLHVGQEQADPATSGADLSDDFLRLSQ